MSQAPSSSNNTTPLEQVLEHTEQVHQEIASSANELLINNAVLKHKVPSAVQVEDVALALKKNDKLEGRVQDAAADLAVVGKVLEQEIEQRASLEEELESTKAALAKATSEKKVH